MTTYDIVQLIISVLSLISTIAISVIIYILERRLKKEQEKKDEISRIKELEHEAEIFIIQNGDEIEYLPLCVFANALNKTIKHKREIYNNFNASSDELQKIILEKQNIFIKSVPDTNWFDFYNKKLCDEIGRLKLGRDLFYDNAKHVKECFDYYRKNELPEVDQTVEYLDYRIKENEMVPWKGSHCDLFNYIYRYLNYLSDIKIYSNPNEINYIEPCDWVYEKALSESGEVYSYWMAILMRYVCCAIREKSCSEYISSHNFYSQAIEIFPVYYEDIYYCALFELYDTFGNFSVENNN